MIPPLCSVSIEGEPRPCWKTVAQAERIVTSHGHMSAATDCEIDASPHENPKAIGKDVGIGGSENAGWGFPSLL